MTLRSLQAVLRSLAETEPSVSDDELLRRFLGGEGGAFAELVRRHGRLVWAVCRNLTGSDPDADDAFQATFLVLLRNAKKIRDAGRLSAWSHGVAYKVCVRAHQAAKLRAAREQSAASSERNGSVVADSAWDRALTAVHEEVGRLPETLRVPFVLCCLEGKGLTEAAGQLGWKLGTFSGRLSRAKDALISRLEARGLTLGAIAGIGLTAAPTAAIARATALVRVGSTVPSSVLKLTHGVIGMSMTTFKVLAAAVLLACGLGVGIGTQWIPTAEAQAPGKPGQANGLPKANPEEELKRRALDARRLAEDLEAALRATDQQSGADGLLKQAQKKAEVEQQYLRAMREMEALLAQKSKLPEQASAKTTRWDYDFVVASDMDQTKFVKFLQDRENRGWEFNGMIQIRLQGKPTETWVFRRPPPGWTTVKPAGPLGATNTDGGSLGSYTGRLPAKDMNRSMGMPRASDPNALPGASMAGPAGMEKPREAKAIEAEINRLQAQLAKLHSKRTYGVTYAREDLPLDAAQLTEVLLKLAGQKFKNAHYSFTPSATGLALEGDKEVIEWAVGMIKKLADK